MLTLPITKKWFDMIITGNKTEEYRNITPYYTTRFINIVAPYYKNESWHKAFMEECEADWYDEFQIGLRNGYHKSSPTIIATVKLTIGTGKPEWGAEEDKKYYVLKILKIEKLDYSLNETGEDDED